MKFIIAAIILGGAFVYGVLKLVPQLEQINKTFTQTQTDLANAETDFRGIETQMENVTKAIAPLTALGQEFQELQKKGYFPDPASRLPDMKPLNDALNLLANNLTTLGPELKTQLAATTTAVNGLRAPVDQLLGVLKKTPADQLQHGALPGNVQLPPRPPRSLSEAESDVKNALPHR